MSNRFRGSLALYAAVGVLALAAVAGCASTPGGAAPAAAPLASAVLTPSATPTASGVRTPPPPGVPTSTKTTGSPPAPVWPSPEDCVSYNPAALTVQYENGTYSVNDGSKVVARLHGEAGDTDGEKALALAQRFRKHCYLGRDNTREDSNSYIFDYWRNPSGMTPDIADQEEDCSNYDRGNLTVEDMGSGYGWRVKDHDHVLHVFDNESDARDGKLVLAKYRQICFIGSNDEDNPEVVSYSL